MKLAILGAKTRTGVQFLDTLFNNGFSKENIVALEDIEEAATRVAFGDEDNIVVRDFLSYDFSNSNITHLINLLQDNHLEKINTLMNQYGLQIIHYNNSFSNNITIPLIVYDVNSQYTEKTGQVVASPSSSTIVLSKILFNLSLNYNPISVQVVANYSVSEYGNNALEELFEQTKGIFTNQLISATKQVFTKQIAFNSIPHVGSFTTNGFTNEEENIALQTNKVLQQLIPISIIANFIPVFIGNSLNIVITFEEDVDLDRIKATLKSNPAFAIVDYAVDEGYVTPNEVVGEEKIYLTRFKYGGMPGRIVKSTITLVAIFDNLALSADNIYKICN